MRNGECKTFCDAHKFLCDAHIFFVSAHKTDFVSAKCSQKKCERSQNKIVSTSGNSGKHYFTNKFSQILSDQHFFRFVAVQ